MPGSGPVRGRDGDSGRILRDESATKAPSWNNVLRTDTWTTGVGGISLAPSIRGRRALELAELLGAVGVGRIQGEGLLVARDRAVALTVGGVGFAEAVVDVPGSGEVRGVPLEDGDRFLRLLFREEPVADPVDLLLRQGAGGIGGPALLVVGDGGLSARQDLLEPGPRGGNPPLVVEPREGGMAPADRGGDDVGDDVVPPRPLVKTTTPSLCFGYPTT